MPVCCGWTWLGCTEFWPQNHPTPLGWSGTLIVIQTLSPNIRVGPCYALGMGANPCSQVPKSGGQAETRWVEAVITADTHGFGSSRVSFGCNVRASTYFWPYSVHSLSLCSTLFSLQAYTHLKQQQQQQKTIKKAHTKGTHLEDRYTDSCIYVQIKRKDLTNTH